MGNRLAISVPSQILPIEFYLKEIPDIQVKTRLVYIKLILLIKFVICIIFISRLMYNILLN